MSDHRPVKNQPQAIESEDMARGPQIRVSVSQPLKDHVDQTAERLGYPSAAEFVREALLFRLALLTIQEHGADVDACEEILRRLLGEPPREAPRARE